MSKANIIAGFAFAGAAFGLLISVLVAVGIDTRLLILPGSWFAMSLGYVLGVDQPAFPLCIMGNLCAYGILGAVVGLAVSKLRKDQPIVQVPECPICGFRWAVPTNSTCPRCGHPRAFTAEAQPQPRCANCRYLLTGNTSGVCPECGKHL